MGGLRLPAKRYAAALLLVAALGSTGCLGGDDEEEAPPRKEPRGERNGGGGPPPPREPIASTSSSVEDADDGGLRFDLMSLDRVDDAVVAQIRLVNEATEDVSVGSNALGGSWTESPPGGFRDVSGFAIADPQSRRLYTPLREVDGRCACTNTGDLEEYFLAPGKDVTVWAAFPAPPASTETVTIVNPMGPPFPPVPIGDGPPPALPRSDEMPDLASLSLDEPVILPITSLTDSLDRSRSVAENDREVDIRLSTDVLFALNSARLSRRARGVLREAARELEEAGARAVRLEGHADSSGTDAINEPLSRRRAAAVGRALRPLVGGDVRFTVRGFGSRRPVASNDDPEGRRRNRRVSLVFARPPETEADAPEEPAAPEGEPAGGQSVEVEGRDTTAGQTVTVELESLRAGGELAVLTYLVTNTGDEEADLTGLLGSDLDDTYRFARNSVMGPTLVDAAERQRYFVAAVPYGDAEVCLCTDSAGAHLGVGLLDPGDEARLYAAYAVPEETAAVTVEMGPDATLPGIAIER